MEACVQYKAYETTEIILHPYSQESYLLGQKKCLHRPKELMVLKSRNSRG